MKTHLGHYEIVGELGRGGMGVVYKGYEPALSRYVAIKELSPSLAHDANLVERFLREARSMAVLNDPNIIQIYFIGTDQDTGQPFFAMEFVEGDSLSGLLKRDVKLSVENALKVLHQTALGLATAHDKGVIHRDIKPGNLMITPRGNVKIADFGIALATQDFSKKLTSTGEFVGTPGYLSPEICIGKTVDQRSDIFSLGIVLYEMLSGAIPFTDESPLGLMLEVVKAEIPDIRAINQEVDAETAAILTRMLAKEPADRFQSCHELAEALQRHPLVAKGGTIRLPVAKPAASDATMVGVPTPASQASVRAATPPPVVGSGRIATPAPAAASAAPVAAVDVHSATRASAVQHNEKRSSAAMPLAVAAVLLLLIGGSAYALRGTIQGLFGTPVPTVAVARAPDGSTGAIAAVSGTNVATADTGTTEAAAAAGVDRMPANPGAIEPMAIEPMNIEPVDIAAAQPADSGTPANGVAANGTVLAAAGDVERPTLVDTAAGAASEHGAGMQATAAVQPAGQAAPVASAQATTKAAPQHATIEPVRPREAAPTPFRIAVVALGDPALTGPVRQQIEARLARAGFELADASLFVSNRDDLPGAMRALRGEATVLVAVQTESLGQRELRYAGRSDTQYSANLSVRAYHIGDRRPLGAGIAERVDFTTINANSQAEMAIDRHLDGIVAELRPVRARG
jgi:eukaryotic-like serine/threonine-protein kinase